MDADCAALAGSFPAARAKISNSLYALPQVDGRSAVARRFRDLVRGILDDMGGLDPEELNDSLREQICTLALLQIRFDALQERALTEEADNETELGIVRLANSLARLRWSLGIGKRKRTTLTPEDALDFAKRGAR